MLRSLYNWTMDKASHPQAVWWLGFFCFIESSFFPIPPHPLLGLMCLAAPKRALYFGIVATLSSVAGGLLGYGIGYFAYNTVGEWLIGVLGMTDNFPVAACYLREYDWEAIVIAGATPVPFKLLTITSGFIHMNLMTFVIASLVGRGMIFFTIGVLFRIFGAPIKAFIDKYLGLVTMAFVLLVVGGIIALTQFRDEDDTSNPCESATLEQMSGGAQ